MLGNGIWAADFGEPAPNEGWTLGKQSKGIRLYTHPVPGMSIDEFRGLGKDGIRIDVVYQVLTDLPAYKDWVDYLAASSIVRHDTPDEYIVYHHYDLPWPFSDRDILVRVTLQRDYDHGMLSAKMRAVPDTVLVPVCEGCVRIPFMDGDIHMRYVTRDSTEGYFTERLDLGGSMPQWLNEMIGSELPFVVLSKLRVECRKPKYNKLAETSAEKQGIEDAIQRGKLKP